MRCCDCQFRSKCNDAEGDNVAFSLCGIRLKKLIEISLQEKQEEDVKQCNKARRLE